MIRVDPGFRGHSAGNVSSLASVMLEDVIGNAVTVAAKIAYFFPDGEVTEALDSMIHEMATRIKHMQSVVYEQQSSIIIDWQRRDP